MPHDTWFEYTPRLLSQLIVEHSPSKQTAVTLTCLIAGAVLAGILLIVIRHRFRRWFVQHSTFKNTAIIFEKAVPFGAGIFTGILELYKLSTLQNARDEFTFAMYAIAGALGAMVVGLPWLISTSKESEKELIDKLNLTLEQTTAQRDAIAEILAGIKSAINAKIKRLAAANAESNVKAAQLPTLLNPSVQIFTLIRSLHSHFARHLSQGDRLRVGVYMRSTDGKSTLTALYSWDGEKDNCFSNRHPDLMDLEAPGGAQSLLVQCYRSEKPLLMVRDCAEASTKGEFTYFSNSQREKIKSMAAYRYLLKESANGEKVSALILTMDTSRSGFFSSAREFECELLMDAVGNRLELELTSVALFKRLSSKK